jgi:branched-chain amino acid transport system substrate-binding protein
MTGAGPISPTVQRSRRRLVVVSAAFVVLLASALLASSQADPSSLPPIRIGAVFPLTGSAASLAQQTERGVQIAADLVNADGGVNGRRIELDVRDLERSEDARAVMASLRAAGASAVIGAYSSDLSIAASAAANEAGLVYWEAGAVADRLTGRGLPLVFRVGASGSNLGDNSAQFAVAELAPRLDRRASGLRVAIVAADDEYARSVTDAARSTLRSAGAPIVADLTYSLTLPRWPSLMARLAEAHADVIILASHIPDGVAFRRAMLDANLRVSALIGSTMAECDPDFAGDLGADAVGIFASDRPTAGFQPATLSPAARATYRRFAIAWAAAMGGAGQPAADRYHASSAGAGDDEYGITGPQLVQQPTDPTEEGLSGFAAAWALFRDVLPAVGSDDLGPMAIVDAARRLDLPNGALPNGAGLRFSSDPATLGQNERATAVIWQWQAVRTYAFVWPPAYATGPVAFVPLAR